MTLATLPLATVNLDTVSNPNTRRRSRTTAAEMESIAMYPGSIHLAHIHADERRKDMFVEAQHARLVTEALRLPHERFSLAHAAANLRHNVGVTLVRIGHRLQHSTVQPAADPNTSLGTLRAVR